MAPGGAGSYVAGAVDSVCVAVCRGAGLFAGPLCCGGGRQFLSFFCQTSSPEGFSLCLAVVCRRAGALFSLLLRLENAISAILAMRILVQFVAQSIGVVMLRRRKGTAGLPFKMWLYPLPVILSVSIWLFIWYSTGLAALLGLFLTALG
jgi:fructoselysine transporter